MRKRAAGEERRSVRAWRHRGTEGGTAGEEEGRPRGEPGEGSRGGEDTRQMFGETARTERSQRRRCGAVPLSQRTLTRAGLVPPLLALN